MNPTFTVYQLSNSLVQISKALSENQYTSADPILKELNVNTLEDAISVLENELKTYSSKNFHPIVAQIIRCLAFSYRISGNQEKWIKSMLICLNSTNLKFLGMSIIGTFEKHISDCNEVTIDVTDVKTPFSFSAGFLNHSIMPNQLPSIIVQFHSQITSNLNVENISIQLKHSETGEISSFDIMQNAPISDSYVSKIKKDVGPFKSGSVTIESIKIKIKNAVIVFHEFAKIGHSEAVIFPFDHECEFSVKMLDYGIINTQYPIKVFVKNIPEGAVSQKCTVEIHNGKDNYSFINSDNGELFSSTIESPKDNTTTDVELMVLDDCLLDITVSVNVSFGIVSSNWKKTYQIQFYNAFNASFSILSANYHYNIKMPRDLLQYGEQAILLSNFTYNCPKKVSVTRTELSVNRADFNVLDQTNTFPIELSKSETFAVTDFIVPLESARSGSLGEIKVFFKDEEDNEMVYTASLPLVNIVDKFVDIRAELLPEIEEKKLYTFNLYGKSLKESFPVDIHIDSSNDFLFDGETDRRERLEKEEKLLASVNFMALRTGELSFPTISIVFVSERTSTILWQDTPSVFVKYQSNSC